MRTLKLLAAAALALLVLAVCFREDPSPDTWFHLAAGRRIVAEHRLIRTNEFLAFEQGHPFVNHEWLFQVIAWLCYALGGETGVGLAKTALVLASFVALALALSPPARWRELFARAAAGGPSTPTASGSARMASLTVTPRSSRSIRSTEPLVES